MSASECDTFLLPSLKTFSASLLPTDFPILNSRVPTIWLQPLFVKIQTPLSFQNSDKWDSLLWPTLLLSLLYQLWRILSITDRRPPTPNTSPVEDSSSMESLKWTSSFILRLGFTPGVFLWIGELIRWRKLGVIRGGLETVARDHERDWAKLGGEKRSENQDSMGRGC